MSCVDSKGFVIETDTANNIWNYHSSDGKNSFFSLPDVVDVVLAEDNDMLIRCQDLFIRQQHQLFINIHPSPVSAHPFHTIRQHEAQAEPKAAHLILQRPIPRPIFLPTRYICLMQTV